MLKVEARSASHYKEVSYKLENKVIELTQNFEQKSQENKILEARTAALESQIKLWIERYKKLEADSSNFKNSTKQSTIGIDEFNALQTEKETLESHYQTSLENIKKQDTEIQRLIGVISKKDDEIVQLHAIT